jgi:hypothetical protein
MKSKAKLKKWVRLLQLRKVLISACARVLDTLAWPPLLGVIG